MAAPSPNWVNRYLALLAVVHAAPSLEGLRRLVRAQVLTVPFENSGSLLRRQAAGTGPVPPLDAEALLTEWEERRAGGVCFEHTEAFGRLLAELGYPVTPIAGEISFGAVVDSTRARFGFGAASLSTAQRLRADEAGPPRGPASDAGATSAEVGLRPGRRTRGSSRR